MKTSFAGKLTVLAACLLATTTGRAFIAGPYTADSFTLHLWHLDETAVPCVDSVASGGTNLVDLAGGATLANASFTGFGNALSTLGTGVVGQGDLLAASPTAGNVVITVADPVTGAFTFEAMVQVKFDPTVSSTAAYEIMAAESGSNPNRIFQWRVAPKGFTLITGITAAQPYLTFENVREVSANQNSIYAPIPITGPDAIVSNGWYHVAVTYNGQPSTPNNIIFYWTAMNATNTQDDALTISSALTQLTGLNPLSTITSTFMLGNQGRSKNGNFLGNIDEVRISKVARGPSGMMFALPSVSLTPFPNQFVAAGTTVTLTSVGSGGTPIGYQWRFNNTNITGATAPNISGYNTSSLVISNVTLAQSGVYTLVATNANSAATNSATVTVGLPVPGLANTGVGANGALLTGGSVDPHWQLVLSPDSTFTGPSAYVDSTLPSTSYLAEGPNSLWIAPGNDVNCAGGIYLYQTSFVLDSQNLTNMQLVLNWAADNVCADVLLNGVDLGVTNNNGFTAFAPTLITTNFLPGTNILICVVSNLPGSGPNPTAFRAELSGLATVLPPTPLVLLAPPANATNYQYQSAFFAVTAYGSGPVSYQWYFGTNSLAGQTNRTLSLANLDPSESGNYTVVITNSVSATNATASLTVITPDLLEWQGLTTDWDLSTSNWFDLTAQATVAYTQNSAVVFDDNITNQNFQVSLDVPLTPNSVVVNASNSFTLTGSGYLAGNFNLLKSGSGTLILDTANTYSGYTLVQAGTLQLGNNDSSGSFGTSLVTNNATLAFSRGDTALNISSPIHGSGTVDYIGSGAVTVSSASDYTGGTFIDSGIVFLQNSAGLGAATGNTTVTAGQLYITANVNVPQPLTLSGAGDGNGALRKGGAGQTTYGGPVTLAADSIIGVDTGSTLTLSNNVTGGTSALIVGGGGTLVLSGVSNSWSGQTTANLGSILQVGDGGADGSLGSGAIEVDGTLTFLTASTITFTNPVTGAGTVNQSGTGRTVFSDGPLTMFTGAVRITGFGQLQLAPGEALTNQQSLTIGSGQGDTNRLELTGGNLVTAPISIFPRAFIGTLGSGQPTVNYPNIVNLAGTNIVNAPSPVNIPSGGNLFTLESDSGYLIYSNGVNGAGAGRDFALQGAGSGEEDGPITQSSGQSINVYKLGQGTWFLNGINSYTGTTIVSNGTLVVNGLIDGSPVTAAGGTLGGTGTLTAPLVVAAPATLAPSLATGPATPAGTLLVSNSMTLLPGSFTTLQINQPAGASDEIADLASVTYGGTLSVTNRGGTLALGNAFQLFSNSGAVAGNFSATNLPALGAGLAWNWNPGSGVLSVVSGLATNPTNITATLNGNQLVLSWPADHLGWILQSQTNSLATGLGTNWVNVPNSTSVDTVTNTIDPAQGSVFYRLAY